MILRKHLLRSRKLIPVAFAMILALCSSCRAPFINKEYDITIYQTGINSVASDVLKETDISPELKASLK